MPSVYDAKEPVFVHTYKVLGAKAEAEESILLLSLVPGFHSQQWLI
jgi:hypothetical protein